MCSPQLLLPGGEGPGGSLVSEYAKCTSKGSGVQLEMQDYSTETAGNFSASLCFTDTPLGPCRNQNAQEMKVRA